jgi:hypothetical protein
MSEYTEGPWSAATFTDPMEVTGPDFSAICQLGDENTSTDDLDDIEIEVMSANARLISAAPDMHEALRAALCDDPDWRRLAVEALAKAEGRMK